MATAQMEDIVMVYSMIDRNLMPKPIAKFLDIIAPTEEQILRETANNVLKANHWINAYENASGWRKSLFQTFFLDGEFREYHHGIQKLEEALEGNNSKTAAHYLFHLSSRGVKLSPHLKSHPQYLSKQETERQNYLIGLPHTD